MHKSDDGRKDGDGWRRHVLNYLISRCPDIKEAIQFAEQKGRDDVEITENDLLGTRTSGGADYSVLDFVLWGFFEFKS